jgi:Zn-dependent peptidase ImmA (M78 family)
MLTLELFEELQGPPEPTLIDALRDFLPLAVKHLKIKELPKIKLLGDVETDHMPSFGKFSNDDRTVHLGIKNRHPNDILRTLAHEMVHYAQGEHGKLDADSWQTGSPEEDQANAEAGVIMREFNGKFPQYMELKPIMLEKWSKKYKKSINCSNPKGFSQKAHCAGRKKNTNEAEDNLEENLRDWFKKDKWVRMDTKGNIKGPCAREPGEGKPKCLPQAKAHALGKKGRASAAQRKRREDPNPERSGKAINVNTKEDQLDEKCWKGYHKEGNKKMFGKTVPNCVKNENVLEGIPFDQCPSCGGKIVHESQLNEKQDACYHKVKSRYKVWPSAYASGALVQCRKKGAANWGNKSK